MAYTCNLTGGFPIICAPNTGGTYEVYIGSWNGTAQTYVLGTSSNIDQIISFGGTTASFYTFNSEAQTAEFKQEGAFNPQNHTTFYNQSIAITLQKMTTDTAKLVNTLGVGRWRAIVKDSNANYWYLGEVDGLKVSAMSGGSGKAKGDLNGFSITLSGAEQDVAKQVTTAAALTLITAAS